MEIIGEEGEEVNEVNEVKEVKEKRRCEGSGSADLAIRRNLVWWS